MCTYQSICDMPMSADINILYQVGKTDAILKLRTASVPNTSRTSPLIQYLKWQIISHPERQP